MADDDDDTWVDAVAGRTPADSRTPAAREGMKLREALLRTSAAAQAGPAAQSDQREAELIARAEREGLIETPEISASRRSLLRFAPAWAAAAAVMIAVGIVFVAHTPPPVVERGDGGIVRIETREPIALKRELIRELKAVGVNAIGYERFGIEGIDADLPQPLTDEVRAVLDRHGIEAPTDGVLRIEIVHP